MTGEAQAMLLIKALDPTAVVEFSEHTGQWYVYAHIDLTDGMFLKSITEHRPTTTAAVYAFLECLMHPERGHVIAAKPAGERRHFEWNGAAFAEVRDNCLPWKLGKATTE